MALTVDQISGLAGHGQVVSRDGDKVGKIGQIYLDDSTGQPTWVTVKTGLFGGSESFAPLEGARLDGDDLVIGYDKAMVKAAPRVEADGDITPTEEQDLFRYYHLKQHGTPTQRPAAGKAPTSNDRARRTADTDDASMVRSEEQLKVSTQQQEAGRATLRKHVVTERQTVTVPVMHEEARVVREPITAENYDRAMDGPELTDREYEVTLEAEKPVVEKEVVPVERVRLDKRTVTEQQQVTAEVRKEQIDTDVEGNAPVNNSKKNGRSTR